MCGGENDQTVSLNSDPKLEAQRQRLPSVVAADLLPSLEGVELGSSGKVNIQYQPPRIGNTSDAATYLLLFCFLSVSDGLLRSVSLPDQRFGENEERRPRRQLRRSDSSGTLPCQRAEKLRPCAPQQRRGAGSV